MYATNKTFEPQGVYFDFCEAVLAQVSSRVAPPSCARRHSENDSPAISVVSLDARSPVQSVSVTVVCTPQLLKKVRQDIRHFNVFTEFVLAVNADHKQVSLAAIQEDVATVLTNLVRQPVRLSICYTSVDEVGFLIEFTDLDSLIKERKLIIADTFSVANPMCPLTWQVPADVFSTPTTFNEQWDMSVKKLLYLTEHAPSMTLDPDAHREFIQHQIRKKRVFNLGCQTTSIMRLIMAHKLSATTLSLPDFIAAQIQHWHNDAPSLSSIQDLSSWCEFLSETSLINKSIRLIQTGSQIHTSRMAVADLAAIFELTPRTHEHRRINVFHGYCLPDDLTAHAAIYHSFYFRCSKNIHMPDILNQLTSALGGIPFVVESKVDSDSAAQLIVEIAIKALIKLPEVLCHPCAQSQVDLDMPQMLLHVLSLVKPIELETVRYENMQTGMNGFKSEVLATYNQRKIEETAKLQALWESLH